MIKIFKHGGYNVHDIFFSLVLMFLGCAGVNSGSDDSEIPQVSETVDGVYK